LEFINGKTKNPGIALILFTLVIRLLMMPLTIKQIKSSKSMAGLKDEMEKIKSRYKDNPLEIQEAVGRLFKEKGINPLSSIGLAVIQIPLFIALYKIVHEAHLFSGAPLGLWINDLGVADPYYILPCLSGLMMFFGMKFGGSAGPQAQKWLTYFSPFMVIIFLLNQPAGLALYILVGSVFQLGVNVMTYG
jgi:YidC/Oxa1 family membrane protein insertase